MYMNIILIVGVVYWVSALQQTLVKQFTTNYFTDDDTASWTISGNITVSHITTTCGGVRIVGGQGVLQGDMTDPGSISKTYTNLPPHYQATISITIYKIDKWDNNDLMIRLDDATHTIYTWDASNGNTNLCGDDNYNEYVATFNSTLTHSSNSFSVEIVSSLESWLGSWGIRDVSITLSRCSESCLTCTDAASCTSCDAGLTLISLYCECVTGRRVVEEPCTQTHCTSCEAVGCPTGHYIYNVSSCAPCNTACSNCTGPANSAADCSACAVGFLDDAGVCESCYGGCDDCFGFARDQCSSCQLGYFYLNSQCFQVCPDGYYGVETLQSCVACVSPCYQCDGGSDQHCVSCIGGYFLYKTQCYDVCPDSMVGYDGICLSSCPFSTYLISNTSQCDDCPTNCRACSETGACTICQPNTYYNTDDQLCYSICPNTYYNDNDNMLCVLCDGQCLTCDGPSSTQCLSCFPGQLLVRSSCYDTCPSHTYSSTCQLCHDECLQCDGGQNTDCLSCQYPLFLHKNDSTCVQTCKQGDIVDNHDRTCVTCEIGYVSTLAQCQPCASTCYTCTGASYLECSSCEVGTYLYNTCLVSEQPPVIYMPDASSSDFGSLLMWILLINISICLLAQCCFTYKTNLLCMLEVSQVMGYYYYLAVGVGQSTQRLLLQLLSTHPSMVLINFSLYNLVNPFAQHTAVGEMPTKVLLVEKTGIYLIDSLLLHLILMVVLMILGVGRITRGWFYGKIYPYLLTYAYRLLFMEHVFNMVLFGSYVELEGWAMIGSLILVLVDLVALAVSVGWKIRTEGERHKTHHALFYFNQIAVSGSQSEAEEQHILPSLIYYVGKLPYIFIIFLYPRHGLTQSIILVVYSCLMGVINCCWLSYHRRIYRYLTGFSQISFIVLSILTLCLSCGFDVSLVADYFLVGIFGMFLLLTLGQVLVNWNFCRSLLSYFFQKYFSAK